MSRKIPEAIITMGPPSEIKIRNKVLKVRLTNDGPVGVIGVKITPPYFRLIEDITAHPKFGGFSTGQSGQND